MKARRTETGPLPRAYWVLWTGWFVNRAGSFAIPLMVVYLDVDRGLSPTGIGALIAVQGVGGVMANIVGGRLSEHVRVARLVTASMVATAICTLLLPIVPSGVLLTTLLFALGFAGELFRPAANLFVVAVIPPMSRARAFGLLHWASNLAFPLSMLLASVAIPEHFLTLFMVDAVTCVVFAGVLLAWLPDAGGQSLADEAPAATPQPAALPPRLSVFCLLTFVVFCVYLQAEISVPLSVTAEGFGASGVAVVGVINGLVIALLQPIISGRLPSVNTGVPLACSYLLIGAGVSLTGVASTWPSLGSTVVLWSLGEIMFVALGAAWVSEHVARQRLGRALGAYGAAMTAPTVVAPLIGGFAFTYSAPMLWGGCAALCLAAAAGQLLLVRNPEFVRRSREPQFIAHDSQT